MTTENFDPAVKSWLKGTADTPYGVEQGVSRLMVRLPQTRQRGRWWPLPLLRRPPAPGSDIQSTEFQPTPIPATNGRVPTVTGRTMPMFSATKFVVAGVIVALFGGFLLAGVLTQPSEEQMPAVGASASPIELPDAIPDDIESGSLDTPLGLARWAHLEGDAQTLPASIDPHPVPGGFVTLTGGDDDLPRQGPLLWRSPDLLTWNPVELPVPTGAGQLMVANGVYWLAVDGDDDFPATVLRSTDAVEWELAAPSGRAATAELSLTDDAVWVRTSDPIGLWRSGDTTSWQEIDLSGIEAPGPAIVEWPASLNAPVSSGDVDIVSIDYYALEGTDRLLGLRVAGGGVDLREISPGVYVARDHNLEESGIPAATLRFEETDGGLQVIDASDGTVLTELEDTSIEFIERWATRELGERRFGVIDGTAVVPIELPSSDRNDSTVFGTADGLFAYVPAGVFNNRPTRVWRSSDGSAWTETDPVPDEVGFNGIKSIGVDAATTRPVVTAWMDGLNWRSTDGVAWDEIPRLRMAMPRVKPLSYPGWMGSWYLGSAEARPLSKAATELAFGTITDVAIQARGESSLDVTNRIFSAIGPDTFMYATASGSELSPKIDIWIVTFDDMPT